MPKPNEIAAVIAATAGRQYRVAWVTEPGRDYHALLKLSERIEFLTTGYEACGEDMAKSIRQNLAKADFEHDIFAPAGRVLSNWVLANMIAELDVAYNVAIYAHPDYTVFKRVPGGVWWRHKIQQPIIA